jgi:hypothetical protein
MSTRSNIIAHLGQDTWARIYCHFDGYPTGVGATLQAHYTDPGKIAALMALGDLSSLHERCDGALGHKFGDPVKGQTVAYGRDRGETGVDATIGATLDSVWSDPNRDWSEYVYVWRGDAWGVCGADKTPAELVPLADVLALADPDDIIDAPVIVPFVGIVGNHAANPPTGVFVVTP